MVFLAQHFDLPLDQRDCATAVVRQAQARQQFGIALEEIRIGTQPAGDVFVGQGGLIARGGSSHAVLLRETIKGGSADRTAR
jgi:hypothetical protein